MEKLHEIQDVNYLNNFHETLWEMRNKGQLCDMHLLLGNTSYQAHSCVLQCTSTFFTSTQVERNENNVQLPNEINCADFMVVLKYMYTGKLYINEWNYESILHTCEILKLASVDSFAKQSLLPTNRASDTEQKTNTSDVSPGTRITDAHPKRSAIDIPTNASISDTQPNRSAIDIPTNASISDTQPNRSAIDIPTNASISDTQPNMIASNNSPIEMPPNTSASDKDVIKPKPISEEEIIDVLSETTMDTDVIKNDSKTAFEYAFVEENEEELEAFKDINADIKYQKHKSGFKSRSGRQIKLPLKYRTSVGNKNKSNYSKMSAVSYDSLINIAEDVESIVCDVKGSGTNEPHADCPSVQEPFATGKSGLKRDSQECPKCHKQFINAKREYHNHCKQCPSDSKNIPARKAYTCTKCDSKFKYQLSYKKHIQNCTSTESTDTPLNNDSPTTLYVRKKKPNFKKYGCDLCSYSSYKRRGLSNHKFNKHAIPYPEHYEIYSCQHSGCDFITAEKTRISTHMKKHSNDKEYACEVCGSRFKHASSLVTHQLIHSEQRPYSCSWDDCTGAFRTKGALENHYKSVHLNERPKRFLCTECGKSYRTRRELNYHMYKHHGQPLPDSYKRYFCELCDYWTEVKRNYEVHLLRHRGDKPEMCEICGKCFVDVSSKNGHKKFHAVDKKFKCTYSDCNFKCIKKKAFLEHLSLMHINKGEKKFQCHLCNYRGAMKGNFTKHLRTVHKLQVITKQKLSQPKLNRETEDLNSAVVITKDGTAVSLSNHGYSETTRMTKDVTEASSDENAYIETILEPEDISSQDEQGYQETVTKESDSESERNDSQVGLSFINQDGTVYRSYRISELKELLLLDKEGASDILNATNMENTLVDVHVEGQSNLQSALCIGEDLDVTVHSSCEPSRHNIIDGVNVNESQHSLE